ncbi:helix-turn-helix domain-containing protein [Pedobacter nyackensis]|uniref:winged helix-turn-helix transcriptional regulator n=1 Tax=Pedobacter nyackensis TaxID=475255 RepID=UPI00292F9DF4|nr:helix-turn-helix domain-containing protein [Pedobacter nyackensis]
MTAIKESSTRNFNKQTTAISCPVTYVMNKIGGHWKPIILYHLSNGPKRYSELKRAIPQITEKMLIQHLKQLQEDDLVLRTAEPVVPPFVTYSVTSAGTKLQPVLNAMAIWGLEDMEQRINGPKK